MDSFNFVSYAKCNSSRRCDNQESASLFGTALRVSMGVLRVTWLVRGAYGNNCPDQTGPRKIRGARKRFVAITIPTDANSHLRKRRVLPMLSYPSLTIDFPQ